MGLTIILSVFMAIVAMILLSPCGGKMVFDGLSVLIDWKLFTVSGVSVTASVLVDAMSLMFSFVVMLISACVFFFAKGYMAEEMHMHRFTYLLFSFVLSMNILVFSPNLISLLLGWDGLGLTSFLLVLYYQNSHSAGAALITALTNRVGDAALIVSVGMSLGFGSWLADSLVWGLGFGVLVVVAAMTKSAQYPFCSWLPMAMAAPTPVSALVHSSTLVTAGVYLLIRFHMAVGQVSGVLLMVGSVTMVLAGLAAFVEYDLKKVIAFSTLSQLGVMVFALGIGMPGLAFFHLLTHAMFKALLFLCAGTCIHYHGHVQDLRGMGNMVSTLPVTHAAMLVANLALCGLPFLAGFYSKDLILEYGMAGGVAGYGAMLFLGFATALTGAYSVRMIGMSQAGIGGQVSFISVHDEGWQFRLPMLVLGVGAVTWGAVLSWLFLPPVPVVPTSVGVGAAPLALAMVGFVLGFIVLVWRSLMDWGIGSRPWGLLHDALSTMWFLSGFSSQYVMRGPLGLGAKYLATVDQGWLEVSQGVHTLSRKTVRRIQVISDNLPTVLLLLSVLMLVPYSLYMS